MGLTGQPAERYALKAVGDEVGHSDDVVSSSRGVTVIIDREELEKRANGLYGISEAEYRRLLG